MSFLDVQPDEDFKIIIDDPKRFTHCVKYPIQLREELQARGATIECLNFKFEDNRPEGEFLERVVAAPDELERKQNGRQVGQKKKARMQAGYWILHPVIGMR